jgi:hypothetical protein
MSLIEHSSTVNGSLEAVFDLTQDYSLRAKWDPFPESYEFEGDATQLAPGVCLTVYAKNGFRMKVRYISYQRPRAAAIEMVSGPWFIERFAGTWLFATTSHRETRVTFKYNVVAGPSVIGQFLQPLVNWSFSRHARARLQALSHYFAITAALAERR